jgi:hypothetical protein
LDNAPVASRAALGRARRFSASLLILSVVGPGCRGFMHSQTGDVTTSYAAEHVTPYVMSTDDAEMACQSGLAMGDFTMSFERVTDRPDLAALSAMTSAASCAEAQAWEAELRTLRALKQGRADEAQDARIEEKRWRAVAAKRYGAAWDRLTSHFGTPGDKCPEFEGKIEETHYLLGLIAGGQAVTHDRASEGEAGIALDVPRLAARGSECLDDARWFGVPSALRAAVWLSVPGATPAGEDPWKRLAEATALGESKGMRLATSIRIESLAAAGRLEEVRTAITEAVAARSRTPTHPEYRLLDKNGFLLMQQMSDRLWTREVGHRTPSGALGSFPGVAGAATQEDSSLFEGLGEPASNPPAPATNP